MSEVILACMDELSNEYPDVCVIPCITTKCTTSDEPSQTIPDESDNISRTIKDHFFLNITKYETSWSGECTICGKIQYDRKGVTSNMNRHVKTQHNAAYQNWMNQLNQVDKNNQKKISDLFIKAKETKRKSSINVVSYNNNHPRQTQLSHSIVQNLIIDLGLPLSIVERDAFVKFMNIVDSKFTLTSRRTLSRTIIPGLYDNMNNQLKRICRQSNFISLTLDVWTDRRLRAYFAMTGHTFVGDTLKSYVLCFLPLHGSHTANALLQTYENAIDIFDIQGKLVRLVTDNAANNLRAFANLIIPGFEYYFENEDNDSDEEGSDVDLDAFIDDDDEENAMTQIAHNQNDVNTIESIKQSFDSVAHNSDLLRIPCFAHTLQLVVNDGLKQTAAIQPALIKVSKIAKLSHASVAFAEKLERLGKSIPKANKTRWNSQFNTVEKVLRIPPSDLNEMLASIKRKDICLLAKDYQMLNEFISLLALFAEATTLTQSENTPSISFIAPIVLSIYFDLLNEQSNVSYANSLCSSLLSSLISRFGGLLEELGVLIDKSIQQKSSSELYRDQIFIYTPFLDDKFKLHWVLESSLPADAKSSLCDKIKTLVYDHCLVLMHGNSTSMISESSAIDDDLVAKTTTSRSTPKRKSLFSNIERKNKQQKVDTYAFIKDEINSYLNDNSESDGLTLIHQSLKYKALSQLAKKVFTVPATSSPVERIFSQSGFLLRQHRSKMSRKTLEMLTMLKCNRGII